MFILSTIIMPNTKVYFVGGMKFSTQREDAKIYETREEAMAVQNDFPDIDLQIERVEGQHE